MPALVKHTIRANFDVSEEQKTKTKNKQKNRLSCEQSVTRSSLPPLTWFLQIGHFRKLYKKKYPKRKKSNKKKIYRTFSTLLHVENIFHPMTKKLLISSKSERNKKKKNYFYKTHFKTQNEPQLDGKSYEKKL